MKNTLLFTYSANILVRLLTVNMKDFNSYAKNPKMCESSRENSTPSSDTSPSASYKEVPPRRTSSTKNHCRSNKNNHHYPLSVVKTHWQKKVPDSPGLQQNLDFVIPRFHCVMFAKLTSKVAYLGCISAPLF